MRINFIFWVALFSLTAGTASAIPTLTMLSPSNGATVSGRQKIEVSVTSARAIQQVIFYRDNYIQIGSVNTKPYAIQFDFNSIAKGTHKLFAVATDDLKQAGASNIITV